MHTNILTLTGKCKDSEVAKENGSMLYQAIVEKHSWRTLGLGLAFGYLVEPLSSQPYTMRQIPAYVSIFPQ